MTKFIAGSGVAFRCVAFIWRPVYVLFAFILPNFDCDCRLWSTPPPELLFFSLSPVFSHLTKLWNHSIGFTRWTNATRRRYIYHSFHRFYLLLPRGIVPFGSIHSCVMTATPTQIYHTWRGFGLYTYNLSFLDDDGSPNQCNNEMVSGKGPKWTMILPQMSIYCEEIN